MSIDNESTAEVDRVERRETLTTVAAHGIKPIATDDNLIDILDEVLQAICLELVETSILRSEDAERLEGVGAFFGALVGFGDPPEPGDGKGGGLFHVGQRIKEQLSLPTINGAA